MSRRCLQTLVIAVLLCAGTVAGMDQASPDQRPPYPAAERGTDADILHGVRVADPYRWLEDLESPRTRSWIKAQDDLTRGELDGPTFQLWQRRIAALAGVRRYTTPVRRGDRWFFFETDANGTSGRVLMMRDGRNGVPQPLVDLRRNDGPDSLSAVMSPSPDGRLVLYGVSADQSRWLRLHMRDVVSGADVGETIEFLHASSGSIAWAPDGRSFYYVRFATPSGPVTTATPTRSLVMRHVIGTAPAADERVLELKDAATRYAPAMTDDGQWLVITTNTRGVNEQRVWARRLRSSSTSFTELFPGVKAQFAFLGAHDGAFWFQTSAAAPRQRIVRVDPEHPEPRHWRDAVPQPADETISYANLIASRLVVFSTRDAAPKVRIHTLDGAQHQEMTLPALTTVWGPSVGSLGFSGRPSDRVAYYVATGVGDPGAVYELDPQTGRTELFLRPQLGFDPNDFVGRQEFYTARDGTRIPIFIAHHKNVRPDGSRPALMYGYGAFGWSAFPWFQPQVLAWMEAGGVYAIPCLRGGGEYGDPWHEAAVREKKQTSVDDYIDAAEWLIAQKYAAPKMVIANGGSASGVVAAAAVLQRPRLFGAALIDIPALDMLRFHRHTGAESWIPEFGSPASPSEFKALRALSPYHNLDSTVCYPPMLVLAGEKDDIAVPSHAYKFVAAAQASQPCADPVLLQVAWGAAHTFGASNAASAENWARQLAFVSRAIGLDPARPKMTPSVLPEVELRGRGETTMVLIPCMSCRWTSWEPFMERNADRWRMLAVTLPGFGGTPMPDLAVDGDSPVWRDNAVAAVARLLAERDLRNVVLVGHSFGARVALQVAAQEPERVSHVVNVDGGIMTSRSWFPATVEAQRAGAIALTDLNRRQFAEAGAWRWFNMPALADPVRRTEYHGMFMTTPREVVFQYWREGFLSDLNPLLSGLRRPLLDIKAIGANDPTPAVTKAQHVKQMREAGANGRATSVFFFNTGHFIHEERPQLLEDTMVAFLEGRPVGDATPVAVTRTAVPGRFGHVERAGTGSTPMILMPCLGCDWRAFDEFMARNAARYRMYAVTWPGMGDTPLPRVAPSRTDTPLLNNVVAALAQLIRDERLEKPVLVAHSAAGPVAVRFAAEHPDLVGRVITVDATIQNDTTLGFSTAQRVEWADAEMAKVLRDYDDDEAWRKLNTASPRPGLRPERRRTYEEMWLTPPRANVLAYWREWLRLDAGRLLSRIEVPTLALFAIGSDTADPRAFRDRMLDQFRRNGASASISVDFVSDASHSIWETQPEAFDRAVERFVSSGTVPRGGTQPRR